VRANRWSAAPCSRIWVYVTKSRAYRTGGIEVDALLSTLARLCCGGLGRRPEQYHPAVGGGGDSMIVESPMGVAPRTIIQI
jgi:hypothetical protein